MKYLVFALSFALCWFGGTNVCADQRSSILEALRHQNMHSESFAKLILGTFAVESDFGRNCKGNRQLGCFQITDATRRHLNKRYGTRYSKAKVKKSLRAGAHLAALKYKSCGVTPKNCPSGVWKRAYIWKRCYNTKRGKGTTTQFYRKYKRYVMIDKSTRKWINIGPFVIVGRDR